MYSDETMQRMALLKTAREKLNNQYIQDRANAFAQWNNDCDRVWKESGIKLPFPPPGPVPSESDVVAYALSLYNVQNPQAAPQPQPQPAAAPLPPVHIVHTVAEPVAVPATVITPAKEESVYEEPVSTPIPVAETIEPATVSTPTPVTAAPTTPAATDAVPVAPDTLVEPIPELSILSAPAPGAADFAKGEAAIKEIFAAPTADPLTMTSSTPSPSVLPLIKGMLKKGLLPSWVRSSDAGIKE